jgi:HK97 gp10 family phage protein
VSEFDLIGMDELLARLQQMSMNAGKVENEALNKAAEPIADAMRKNVPVSTVEQKHIRDDIEISKVKSKDGVKYIEIGPGKDTNWRAKFLEFGTSKMNAEPFMEPSYLQEKDNAQDIIKQHIKGAIGL